MIDQESEVMPYPGDCTKYQICDYSGCFVFTCAPGTEFNPNVNVCDYPLADRQSCGKRAESLTSSQGNPSAGNGSSNDGGDDQDYNTDGDDEGDDYHQAGNQAGGGCSQGRGSCNQAGAGGCSRGKSSPCNSRPGGSRPGISQGTSTYHPGSQSVGPAAHPGNQGTGIPYQNAQGNGNPYQGAVRPHSTNQGKPSYSGGQGPSDGGCNAGGSCNRPGKKGPPRGANFQQPNNSQYPGGQQGPANPNSGNGDVAPGSAYPPANSICNFK